MYNNQLYHYGVLGMKWGRRKSRVTVNKGTSSKKGKKEKRVITPSDDAREAANLRKKKPIEMSNAELRKLNERKQLMQTYSKLNPSKLKKGVAFVAATVGVMNTITNVYNSGNNVVKMGKNISESIMKDSGSTALAEIAKNI